MKKDQSESRELGHPPEVIKVQGVDYIRHDVHEEVVKSFDDILDNKANEKYMHLLEVVLPPVITKSGHVHDGNCAYIATVAIRLVNSIFETLNKGELDE